MNTKIKKYCPNCSQLYNLKSLSFKENVNNIPLLLKCGHSMCENCVKNIIKFREPIECKVCLSTMEITDDIQKKLYQIFPVNIYILGELTLECLEQSTETKDEHDDCFLNLDALIKGAEIAQEQCIECQNPTNKMCKQCAYVLCDTCFRQSHKNFVIFSFHVLQNIEPKLSPTYCKIHKEKSLDYYCQDCSKSICMDCLMVGGEKSCKNHNLTSMQEVNEGILEKLSEISPKIEEIFKRLTKTAVDIGHILYNVQNETKLSDLTKKTNEIEQHFSKITSAIQKHKSNVIEQIEKLKNAEKDSLLKARSDIADSIIKAKETMMVIGTFLTLKTIKQVNMSAILEDAKQIMNAKWYLNKGKENESSVNVAVNENLCKLINDYIKLNEVCSIEYSLLSTSELDPDKIPPPPPAPVYPPQLPRDVRQLNKEKKEKKVEKKKDKNDEKENESIKQPTLYKSVPKYRSKSGSVSSTYSINNDTYLHGNTNSYDEYQGPTVQPVAPFLENQHPKQLYDGCQELIYVSHIVSPHNFFVQRVCHQSQVEEMLREFRDAASLPKPSVNHVTEGKLYLVYNKADNMWQRCRVLRVNRNNTQQPLFQVFCIDFGSTEETSIDALRLMPPARMQSPIPFAINCSLINCEPLAGSWTSDDAILIQNIIDNKQAVIHIHKIHSTSNYGITLDCDVTTFEGGVSLAHALAFHGRARINNPKLPYPRNMGAVDNPKLFISNNDFKPNNMEEVYITYINSPDNFYVRKRHFQSTYEKLCEALDQEYSLSVNTGSIYLPIVGMVCVVNVEKYLPSGSSVGVNAACGTWARAVVRELPGRARVRVSLPDTGATLLVHWSTLRQIHTKFTTQCALATECHLARVSALHKKWNPNSVTLLRTYQDRLLEIHVEEKKKGKSLGVILYDKSDEENVICINNEMVKHKFAVSFGGFIFNKQSNVEAQVITTNEPLNRGKKHSNTKTKNVTVLKKQASSKSNVSDVNLEAKEKGPLRLEAKVLYYQSPSLIYVSLVHQQKTFNELYEKMQCYYSKKTEDKKEWAIGDRCCAMCQQSHTWRRAAILELEGENAKVFYSDFACIESVPISSLRKLPSEFAQIGDAAFKCHMCGVIPAAGTEWPSLTKEYLKEMLDVYKRIFITKVGHFKDKSMPVEIWVYHTTQGGALEANKSEWRCLNNKIIDQGLGIPETSLEVNVVDNENETTNDDTLSFLNIKGSIYKWLQLESLPIKPFTFNSDSENNSKSSTPFDDLENKDLETLDNVFISDWLSPEPFPYKEFTAVPTYIDSYGTIYLHDVLKKDTLDLIHKALKVRFGKPDPNAKFAKWTVGEPCIALYSYDNNFYRAKILSVNKEASTCLVHYIDYGNNDICTFSNLRKGITLHEIPTQASKCFLSRIRPLGYDYWNKQFLDYIHKSIVEKQCFIRVSGEQINGVTPIELKVGNVCFNDDLVELEMAEYCDDSKPVVRMGTPNKDDSVFDNAESFLQESCISDKTINNEDDADNLTNTMQDSLNMKMLEGKDWNAILAEEEEKIYEKENYITYARNDKVNLICNITIVNDVDILELSIIQPEEIVAAYDLMFQKLQEKSNYMTPINGVFENKACVAIFPDDGLWYRASILEYNEASKLIKVKYVDYGNIEVISLSDVREIDKEFVMLPPLTISAILHKLKVNPEVDINVVAKEYADTFLVKGPFYAKIIECNNSMPCVELKNNKDELVYKHLIEKKILLCTDICS